MCQKKIITILGCYFLISFSGLAVTGHSTTGTRQVWPNPLGRSPWNCLPVPRNARHQELLSLLSFSMVFISNYKGNPVQNPLKLTLVGFCLSFGIPRKPQISIALAEASEINWQGTCFRVYTTYWPQSSWSLEVWPVESLAQRCAVCLPLVPTNLFCKHENADMFQTNLLSSLLSSPKKGGFNDCLRIPNSLREHSHFISHCLTVSDFCGFVWR